MNTAIQDSFDLGWKLAWVLRGWAPHDLLDTHETERRPIGLHNVERAAQSTGSRAGAGEALPWDLNGRLAHHWIRGRGRPISTLDLVGEGLTVLAGPGDLRWADAKAHHRRSVPMTVHLLDAGTADGLELAPNAAMLVRPDGREVRRWPDYDRWLAEPSWPACGLAAKGGAASLDQAV